jgi:hypothetical protein
VRKSLALTLTASLALAFGGATTVAYADSVGPTTFESPTFAAGSVDGQEGWKSTGDFDQAVEVTNRFPRFGAQSLRISNAVTSGAFANQTFSAPVEDPAGETTAQKHFDATFALGSMLDAEQPGLVLSVSPDDGNGARMSYLRFEDKADGVHVLFDDVTDAKLGDVADFKETDIATLDRAKPHTVRFAIDFYTGPANDVAKIYLDGALEATGTTWEDYYRYDPEAAGGGNKVLPVDRLLFRAGGTAAPDTLGKGFLIDNPAITSSVPTADTTGPTTFESPMYSAASVNGQNGWQSTGAFDQAVAPTTRFTDFDDQSLRISNAVTSGSFGDQTFSPATAKPAGEATDQRHYDATFQMGTALAAEQTDLRLTVSPDDGNGGRMSFLRFEDKADGIHAIFSEATNAGPVGSESDFTAKDIATMDRANAHTIRFSIDYFEGPSNDVVKVYVDGVLKNTGTTWENYYRYDPEATPGGNTVPTTSKLLFRASGIAAPATKDGGFLFDNLLHSSSMATAPTAPTGAQASALDGSAQVSWKAPASNGGSAITGYTVTALPGGATASTTGAMGVVLHGLANGTAYTFSVTADNEVGTSPASAASTAVMPAEAALPPAPVSRVSDFNRDGFTDLVARDAAGRLWLYPGNGAGGFKATRAMGFGWNGMTAIVTPGDVTADGIADVLAKDSAGRLWLYAGNGANGLRTKRQIGNGWASFSLSSAANLNGTGGPDLLARDSAGGLWLYPMSGNASFGTKSKIGTGWKGYSIMGPGDFSGDRRADILARDPAGALWLYAGNGAGRVGARTRVSSDVGAATAMVTAGNWDRVGGNDLLTRNAAGVLWLNAGNNASQCAVPRQIGNGWQGMTFLG